MILYYYLIIIGPQIRKWLLLKMEFVILPDPKRGGIPHHAGLYGVAPSPLRGRGNCGQEPLLWFVEEARVRLGKQLWTGCFG